MPRAPIEPKDLLIRRYKRLKTEMERLKQESDWSSEDEETLESIIELLERLANDF